MKTLTFTLLLSLFALSAEACPLLNGKFVKRESLGENRTSTITLELATKVTGDEYRYSIFDEMDGVIANGMPATFREGDLSAQLKVSCGDDRVRFDWDISNQGQAAIVITRVDENTVQVSGSSFLTMISGTFRKE